MHDRERFIDKGGRETDKNVGNKEGYLGGFTRCLCLQGWDKFGKEGK